MGLLESLPLPMIVGGGLCLQGMVLALIALALMQARERVVLEVAVRRVATPRRVFRTVPMPRHHGPMQAVG